MLFKFQWERNRTLLEKELWWTDGSQETIAAPETTDKEPEASPLPPQKRLLCSNPLSRKGQDGGGGRGREEGFQGPLKGKSKENELSRPSLDGMRIREVAPSLR